MKNNQSLQQPEMHIGLLRHFPVSEKLPAGWINAVELDAWRERYDAAEPSTGECDLGGVTWQACLSSDLPRTRITAGAVFRGKIEYTSLLREPQIAQFNTGRLRLPIPVWQLLLRFAWITGHRSQREYRDEFRQRVLAVAERLSESRQDILVVAHAGIMAYLSEELRRRGLAGPKLRVAEHGKVYMYVKNRSLF